MWGWGVGVSHEKCHKGWAVGSGGGSGSGCPIDGSRGGWGTPWKCPIGFGGLQIP